MKTITLTVLLVLISVANTQGGYDVATFTDTGLINGLGQYNNSSGGFTSGGQYFNNTFHSAYGGYWNGFSVSSTTDTTTPGYTNQYSSITGGGANGSIDYAVLYPSAYVNLTGIVQSIELTNTTYAYLSMLNGDSFESAFTTGSFFNVVITGYTGLGATGTSTGSVTYSLANYTSPTSTPVNTWNTVNLTSLGNAVSLGFSFQSSATGQFGINTPEYVAVDDLTTFVSVPEPSSLVLCLISIGIGAIVRRRQLARITGI
jgi:hypothetical protein